MRTPATAMVWELWRLSRREMAFRISFVLIAGLAALSVSETFDRVLESGSSLHGTVAFMVLLISALQAVFSASWVKSIDNRQGFPLYLGYARPVPTWLLVGVPMAYLGISCAMSYFIPIAILKAVFGIPFPLTPVVALVSAMGLIFAACNWWTQDKVLRFSGIVAAAVCIYLVIRKLHPVNEPGNDFPPERWSEIFDFSLADYGIVALLAAAAIGLSMVGVERQRRGDDTFSFRRWGANTLRRVTVWDWLIDLFQAPCPTSSPTRAQVWWEMKCVGVPVLAIGATITLGIPVFLSLAIAYESDMIAFLAMGSPLAPLLVGITTTFGIRRKQGSAYMSAFDATRALGTARLAGVKVLVTVIAILCAWAAIGTSLLASFTLVVGRDVLGEFRRVIGATFDALPAYWLAIMATVALIQFSAVIALLASKQVFLVFYERRVVLAVVGLGLYFLTFAFAIAREWVGATFVEAHAWIVAALILFGTAYLFRAVLKDRIFTPRLAAAAFLVWTGYAAAHFAVMRQSGIFQSELAPAYVALIIASCLVPLGAVALAPWSFGLIRHR